MLEVIIALAVLGLFIAGGIFLIVRYNSMSQGITHVSAIQAATYFVRDFIRQDSVLRAVGDDSDVILEKVNERLVLIENALNGPNEGMGFLATAGFGNLRIEISPLEQSSVMYNGNDWILFTVEAMISDIDRNSKEEKVYVTISSQ
ncbi:hypothetical protein BG32_08660 [Mesotoga sp. HF07.pep.5.2.highcov]|nr:hypothetical protein [Thermotogota bacterium]RLL86046.1 hypothetical protein Y696_10130 [Mesotoga sp. H07pep.5.4]RLL92747.1 hypothetical protein BG32_08660 [Mesotoga sp. HF07.pep.5.2.highcov]